jgi:hypothetical protein
MAMRAEHDQPEQWLACALKPAFMQWRAAATATIEEERL